MCVVWIAPFCALTAAALPFFSLIIIVLGIFFSRSLGILSFLCWMFFFCCSSLLSIKHFIFSLRVMCFLFCFASMRVASALARSSHQNIWPIVSNGDNNDRLMNIFFLVFFSFRFQCFSLSVLFSMYIIYVCVCARFFASAVLLVVVWNVLRNIPHRFYNAVGSWAYFFRACCCCCVLFILLFYLFVCK